MAHVESAFEALDALRHDVLLLGIVPDTHETEYGWIEPGGLLDVGERLYRVSRFWEKPEAALASALRDRGCYWNSFVMVARVSALLGLIQRAIPGLFDLLAHAGPALGTAAEGDVVRSLYDRLPGTDFSREVLATCVDRLAVPPAWGVTWSDLGSPERVSITERRILAAMLDGNDRIAWAPA
jgi:mannose-1-phosphate guanylyltransferase